MDNSNQGGNLGTMLALTDMPARTTKQPEIIVPKSKSAGFVRIKWIPNRAHGKPYYYLVKSILVDGKPRQKVIKYLGVRPPRGMGNR